MRQSQRQRGFTLIEVLIAMAIVGIAMTAIIKATGQTIRSSTYLQQKTIALWVAQNILNSARVGLIKLPLGEDASKQSVVMLNQQWYWHGYQLDTPIKAIKQIHVAVYEQESDEAAPLIELESYRYDAPK